MASHQDVHLKVRIHVEAFAIDDHSNVEADAIYAALVMLPLEFKLNLQCQILTYKNKKIEAHSFEPTGQYKHLTKKMQLSAWLNEECLSSLELWVFTPLKQLTPHFHLGSKKPPKYVNWNKATLVLDTEAKTM